MPARPSPSTLEAHLGYWLRRVSNAVSGAFVRALQAEQVSAAEWVVLRLLLGEAQKSPGDLAVITGLTRGAISKVLDKLEAKNFVARTENPDDSRAQRLSLTRTGQRLVPRLAALADQNDDHFFSCLTTREQAELRRLFEKLAHVHGLRGVPVE
jgi:DNA-binding MarR family transcriptional regulator